MSKLVSKRNIFITLAVVIISILVWNFYSNAATVNPITSGKMIYHSYSTYSAFDSRMFVYDFATQVSEELKFTGVVSPMNAKFSNDGSKITFMAIPSSKTKSYYNMDVYLYDLNTKSLVNLTPNSGVADEDPNFSNDDQKIVYKTNGDLRIMKLDGSLVLKVTNNGYRVEESIPYFSPDDKSIIYTQGSDRNSSIMKIDVANNVVGSKTLIADHKKLRDYYAVPYKNEILYTSTSIDGDDDIYSYANKINTKLKFNTAFDESDVAIINDQYLLYSTTFSLPGDYDYSYKIMLVDRNSSQTYYILQDPSLPNNLNELGIDYTP